MKKTLVRFLGLALLLIALVSLTSIVVASPSASTGSVTIVGVSGDTSNDPGALFAPRYLRYVGNPPPGGYDPSHNYQWGSPGIFLPSPEDGPIVLQGTIDIDDQVVGQVAMIGLLDQSDLEAGNSSFQRGAYIYVSHNSATQWRIGVSDGNAGGGEIVQTFVTVSDTDLPSDGVLNVVFTVDGTADGFTCDTPAATAPAGCMTLEITGGSVNMVLTDSYGDLVGNNSASPEFANGAVLGWDDFLGSSVGYSLTTDAAVLRVVNQVHPLGTTTSVPAPDVCASGLIDNWFNNWFACDENSANTTGGVVAIFGPATPPLGTGSAQFTIGENADGPAALTPFEPGLPFSQLTKVTYDTYWDSSDGNDDRPNFFINVDYDLTDSYSGWQGRLVWITTGGCPALTSDTWQTLNPLGSDACWRQTGIPVVGDSPQAVPWPLSGGPSATWAEIKAQYPNAGIHTAPLGALGFKMGSGHNPSVTALDSVKFGVDKGSGEVVTVYNFETAPTLAPVGDIEICAPGTVDIQVANVAELYGFEFIVEYDKDLVSANGNFVDTWFDPNGNGFPGPATPINWQAECDDSAGICRFAYTRGAPNGELSTAVPETIASVQFTPTLSGPAGDFDVMVTGVKLTDKDSFEIPGAIGGTLNVDVCGAATVSGKVSLQGRPQPGRPVISGDAPSFFEVKLVGPFGPISAAPDPVDGTFELTGVPYLASGTDYTITADHSVYIRASKLLTVNSAAITGQNTTLLGGDATDNDAIGSGDLACVGGQFGTSQTPPTTYTCTGGNTTPDLNDDFQVNIQDLSLVGGNYGIAPVPQPWP